MNAGLVAQFVMNGLMLGMMYALVAVGFTLFFGVLDVIKFSHGDVLTVGAFAALATYLGLQAAGLKSNWLDLVVMVVVATAAMAFLGILIARYLVMPLRSAPALNTLLITLMISLAKVYAGAALPPNRNVRAGTSRPGFSRNRLYNTMMCSTFNSWRLYSWMRLIWQSKIAWGSTVSPSVRLIQSANCDLAPCLALAKASHNDASSAKGLSRFN